MLFHIFSILLLPLIITTAADKIALIQHWFQTEDKFSGGIWRYDWSRQTWVEFGARLGVGRHSHTCVAIPKQHNGQVNRVIVAGGLADGDDTLPVEILHLSTGKIKVRLFDTAARLEKFRIFCQSMKTIIFIYLRSHFPQIKSLTLLRKAFIKPFFYLFLFRCYWAAWKASLANLRGAIHPFKFTNWLLRSTVFSNQPSFKA